MRTVVLLEVDKVPTTSVMMGLAYRTVALDEEVTVVVPMAWVACNQRRLLKACTGRCIRPFFGLYKAL